MATILVCNDELSVSLPIQLLDIRFKIQQPNCWKDLADVLKAKIVKQSGVLRIQIGVECRYSGKIEKTVINETYLKEFANFFEYNGHNYDELIFITFIGM